MSAAACLRPRLDNYQQRSARSVACLAPEDHVHFQMVRTFLDFFGEPVLTPTRLLLTLSHGFIRRDDRNLLRLC
jgi:hypothetical protein